MINISCNVKLIYNTRKLKESILIVIYRSLVELTLSSKGHDMSKRVKKKKEGMRFVN